MKHAVRFRHRRGYGVHSPFMFQLITGVICARRNRYTYPPPAEALPGMRWRERKLYRLAYRLCAHLEFRTVLCTGNGIEGAVCYLEEIPAVRQVETDGFGAVKEAAFIFVGTEASAQSGQSDILDIPGIISPGERKCILMTEIHRNSGNLLLWRRLKDRATVSVDMMWYGILLFDEKLQQGKYYLTI
ncbi:MAG: hypothetical protein LBR65_04945 [Culturomica sp.]|nr:hypothetical protein [Culturomica sp.]